MAQRRRHQSIDVHPRTGKRIKDLSSVELHQTLVSDAVQGIETPLWWAVAAYRRIGRLDKISDDAAYLRVEAEVRSLGAFMPGVAR